MSALEGRVLHESDNLPGAPRVAVIGHALWMNRFNGDPTVVGRSVRINGAPATVVGVMPPVFRFPRKHDIWIALPLDATTERGTAMPLEAFGRLRDGATPAAASAEIQAQLDRSTRHIPDQPRRQRHGQPLGDA